MSAPTPPSSGAPATTGDRVSDNSTNSHATTNNNASHSSDDDDGRVFFASRSYNCKDDVITAVAEYNHMRRRAYKVHTSDRRRYQVRCVDDACAFVVRFAFSTAFKPPTRFCAHTCSTSDSASVPAATSSSSASTTVAADGASSADAEHASASSTSTNAGRAASGGVSSAALLASRACRATQIARYPEVRALVAAHGEQLKAAWIKDVLVHNGLRPTYANCFHARKRLLHEFAEDPHAFIEQQQSRRGYVLSLAAFAPAVTGSGSGSSDSATESLRPGVSAATATAPCTKRQRTDDSAVGSTSTSSSTRIGDLLAPSLPLQPAPPAIAAPSSQVSASVAVTEPEGCCFICPAAAVPSTKTQELLLQWQVRDPERAKTLVDLYDGSRRIEILRSGTYRLHVYIEPVGSHLPSLPLVLSLRTQQCSVVSDTSASASAHASASTNRSISSSNTSTEDDTSAASSADDTYHLLLNNVPLSAFKHEVTRRSSQNESDSARDAVPTRVFNVADVPLKRWDMLVLRWTRGTQSSTSTAATTTTAQTAFVRFILELVR